MPSVSIEEQVKRRDAEDLREEGTKGDEDGDAMDVERTSAQLLFEGTTTNHAKEHPIDRPPSIERKDAEGGSRVNQ